MNQKKITVLCMFLCVRASILMATVPPSDHFQMFPEKHTTKMSRKNTPFPRPAHALELFHLMHHTDISPLSLGDTNNLLSRYQQLVNIS